MAASVPAEKRGSRYKWGVLQSTATYGAVGVQGSIIKPLGEKCALSFPERKRQEKK